MTREGASPPAGPGNKEREVRVSLPGHLRNLADAPPEVAIRIPEPATIGALVNAIEETYPMLRGTIREIETGKRRAYLRYLACGEDLSHRPDSTPLPGPVASGQEVFNVIGAISGG